MQSSGQVSPDGNWLWNGVQWVPYQQPNAGLPVWARPYESARSRSQWATIFLAANLASLVLLTIALVVGVDLAPDNPSDAQNAALAILLLGAVVAYLGTFIPAIVFFCMWLHAVIRNMPALGSADARWTPGGAVGRCFIPFLSLVHPLYSTLDAWRGSDSSHRYLDVTARKSVGVPALFSFWWGSWLVGGFIGRVSAQATGSSGAVIDVIDGAVLVLAAVLAIRVVRGLTARQDLKNELIASGQLV